MPCRRLPVALAALAIAAAAPGAGVYRLEPARTRVTFAVSEFGLGMAHGEFPGASGRLILDPARPAAAQIDVTIPVAGVTTPNPRLASALRAPKWLDAARFPAMTFHSTAVTPTGPGEASVAGELTLHGVTRPVVFQARFAGASGGPAAGFAVHGRVRRSEFGVRRMLAFVGDVVELDISATFAPA
jgi:polyisoprenoid-binding protein YceI